MGCRKHKLAVLVFSACIAVSCSAQILRDALQKSGIPSDSFSSTELAQTVNSINSGSSVLTRYELRVDERDRCCGSPLAIDFTRDYLLISFHDTPSASTVLVTDGQLRLIGVLYGFDFHEVGPDQVVYIENMVHFAPQHPERLRFADLRTGKTEELYPLEGDPLRAAFARANEAHMPAQVACRQGNDPCNPNGFDETIQFVSNSKDGSFTINVDREASHPTVDNWQMENHLSDSTKYRFRQTGKGWVYCESQVESPDNCTPNLAVIANPFGERGPFPAFVRKPK